MKTPHVHAEAIRGWANGEAIETLVDSDWVEVKLPTWYPNHEYRIKPEPEPDLIYYVAFGQVGEFEISATVNQSSDGIIDTLKLAFCAETHKLKSVEILK